MTETPTFLYGGEMMNVLFRNANLKKLYYFLSLACFMLLIPNWAIAEIYCVANSSELEEALVGARTNGQDYEVRIVQGKCSGLFLTRAEIKRPL